MNKIIKDQISQLKPSATLAINEETNRLKKAGKKIYKFGFGQSPFPIPSSIVSELKKNAHKHTYLPMQGLEELRLSIANYLNKHNKNNFKSEDIVIGPGTKALMLLTQIIFNGEVILSAPSWVSYQPQAFIAKNKVHWIQTSNASNWFPTAEQIENKIKTISIKKNDQFYLFKLIETFPKINYGRKNYTDQYYRVLKNILLSQAYDTISKKKLTFQEKFSFKEKDKFLSIQFKL